MTANHRPGRIIVELFLRDVHRLLGKGFRIHVQDKDTFFWTRRKRLKLVRSLVRRGYVMDGWVAAGGMRHIHLPHSLNELVSRIATPLKPKDLDGFDPLDSDDYIPRYLRGRY